jgi:hypothetical protein
MIGATLRQKLRHPYNRRHPVSAILRYLEWRVQRTRRRPWKKRFWEDREMMLYPDSSESMWLPYNVVMDWPEFSLPLTLSPARRQQGGWRPLVRALDSPL